MLTGNISAMRSAPRQADATLKLGGGGGGSSEQLYWYATCDMLEYWQYLCHPLRSESFENERASEQHNAES